LGASPFLGNPLFRPGADADESIDDNEGMVFKGQMALFAKFTGALSNSQVEQIYQYQKEKVMEV
jgi:hypothetical protein